MRQVLFVLAALLCSQTAAAQEQDVSMSVTTVEGHPMISITNAHSSPIEAFLVTVDVGPTSKPLTRIYYDVHSNYKRDVPIPPGTSQQVPLPSIVGQDLPVPTLRAVVFSDGTSVGDSTWVHELLHRRKILSDRMEEVMALLKTISDQKLTREEALDALEKARQARKNATSDATLEERVWHDQVFYMAIRNLQGNQSASGKVPDFSRSLDRLNHALSGWLLDLQTAKPSFVPRAGGPN
jgi:hypothetical protein